mgnify:CR=1 FL=1
MAAPGHPPESPPGTPGRAPPQSQHEQQSQQSQSQSRQAPSRFLRDHGPSYSLAQHSRQVQHSPIATAHPAQNPRRGFGGSPPGCT